MKEYNAMLLNFKAHNIPVRESEFNEQAFGSWYIETKSQPVYRVVHDGRDRTIVLEVKHNNEWSCLLSDKTKSGRYVLQKLVDELNSL